jgi:hypothetical protein
MNITELIKKHLNKVVKEQQETHISEDGTYMVLSNLVKIKDDIETILSFKHQTDFPKLVTGEHAWAGDHITTSADDIEEVANFIKGYFEQKELSESEKKNVESKNESYGEIDESKNCPTDPAKWATSKAKAKAKYDVYPSAYSNGFAAKDYKAKGGGWKKCK